MTRPVELDLKGLTLNVYRPVGYPDCTNGGLTGCVSRVTLVGYQTRNNGRPGRVQPLPRDMQVFAPTDDAPAVVLVTAPNLSNDGRHGPYLTPLQFAENGVPNGVGPMAGGNVAGTSDSRFSELLWKIYRCNGDAVRVHDRVETPEQYRALST